MAWLKIYEWERAKFPEMWATNVVPEHRAPLTEMIAASYGFHVNVRLTKRGGGSFHRWVSGWASSRGGTRGGVIKLPFPSKPCSLGVIVHELAHGLNWAEHDGTGHTGMFKHCLIKLAVEVPPRYDREFLPKLLAKDKEREAVVVKDMQRREAKEAREVAQRAKRKTYEFKRARLEAQIKRLESRQKRVATMLYRANRRLVALNAAQNRRRAAQAGQGGGSDGQPMANPA